MKESNPSVPETYLKNIYSRDKAMVFLRFLDENMSSDIRGPQQIVLDVLDALHTLFVEIKGDSGFKVSNNPYNGNEVDLFHEVTKNYWDAILFDEDLRSGNNISFFDIDDSRKTFLVVLGTQLLTNVPDDVEEVRKHVKQQVANVFNGKNFFNVKFTLTFIAEMLMSGETWETVDLADLI